MSTDEPQPARQTWDDTAVTPIHDRLYGRSASAYGVKNSAETPPRGG